MDGWLEVRPLSKLKVKETYSPHEFTEHLQEATVTGIAYLNSCIILSLLSVSVSIHSRYRAARGPAQGASMAGRSGRLSQVRTTVLRAERSSRISGREDHLRATGQYISHRALTLGSMYPPHR